MSLNIESKNQRSKSKGDTIFFYMIQISVCSYPEFEFE